MYSQRQNFEIYLEILTQISYGNSQYDGIKKCTLLPNTQLDQTLNPLLTEGLLTKVGSENDQKEQAVYRITPKGEQFMELTRLAFSYVELSNEDGKKLQLPDNIKKKNDS